MKPVDQLIVGPGGLSDGTPAVGDCWRASIASVLELPAEEVPHFGAMSLEEWWPATQDWLNARGLFLLEWDYDPEGFALPGYTLLSGKSPRGDYDHTVVGWGLEPVHDPHPSRSGLVGAPKRWAVFVALDPSAAIPKESLVGDRGPG